MLIFGVLWRAWVYAANSYKSLQRDINFFEKFGLHEKSEKCALLCPRETPK